MSDWELGMKNVFMKLFRALLIIYEVLQHQIKNGECVVVMFFDIHECVKLFLMNYENFWMLFKHEYCLNDNTEAFLIIYEVL